MPALERLIAGCRPPQRAAGVSDRATAGGPTPALPALAWPAAGVGLHSGWQARLERRCAAAATGVPPRRTWSTARLPCSAQYTPRLCMSSLQAAARVSNCKGDCAAHSPHCTRAGLQGAPGRAAAGQPAGPSARMLAPRICWEITATPSNHSLRHSISVTTAPDLAEPWLAPPQCLQAARCCTLELSKALKGACRSCAGCPQANRDIRQRLQAVQPGSGSQV